MTNRQDLWNLLISRIGQWVSRENIDFVGGSDSGRRMREIRADIVKSGRYRLEERRDEAGRFQFRLVEVADQNPHRERYLWRCVKCQSHPGDMESTINTMDPRWRKGRCPGCGDKQAIFRKATADFEEGPKP